MGRLAGKIAVITGGTSGIGKRSVERFVEEGASVVVGARREAEGQALAAALGPRVHFLKTDVAREDDVKALIDRAMSLHGRIDALFNNAGGPAPTGSAVTFPMDGVEAALRVLFCSVVSGVKHVAPIMVAQGGGSIFSNASIAGSRAGFSSSMIYSAAKAAVIHFSRCAAMEFGEKNVRVNTISPGGIATGIFGKALGVSADRADDTGKLAEAVLKQWQPIPRAGQPDDIANAAVYLASDESSFINGHDLIVDGGIGGGRMWTAQWEGLKAMREAFGVEGS